MPRLVRLHVTPELWVLSMELVSYHTSDAYNLELPTTVLENL